MFLNFIKEFFLKRRLKLSLNNVKTTSGSAIVNTIGLLIDESYFLEKEALIQQLKWIGFDEEKITLIVYRDKFKKNGVYDKPTFGRNTLQWNSEITDKIVNNFIKQEFDLLISYYDVEKSVLLQITNNSNAHFKVGFSSIDKRLNHLIINSNVENHAVFIHELFRYLKILNKI